LVPTAKQVVSLGQLIALTSDPWGIELVVCEVEKRLTVLTEVAPPPDATPTATHVCNVEQDNEERKLTGGWYRVFHDPPLVPTIAGLPLTTPMAAHVMALEHDTVERASVPDGEFCGDQVDPSTVCTILTPSTAVHSSIVKHEMD
jgi:hypothetical protein